MVSGPGRIVVGVDGSRESLTAIRWAVHQAELTGGSIEAVIAWQFPNLYGAAFDTDNIDWAGSAQSTLDTALNDAGLEDTDALTRTVVQGHPAEVLIKAASGAELLVVGSRGHGGFVGMLVGSVSEFVIAHASCPVVVTHYVEAA